MNTAAIFPTPDPVAAPSEDVWAQTLQRQRHRQSSCWSRKRPQILKQQNLPASIVLTSSANAVVPKRGSEAYDVSKAGGQPPDPRARGRPRPAGSRQRASRRRRSSRDRRCSRATASSMSLRKYAIAFDEAESTEALRTKLAEFYAQRTITQTPILPRRLRQRDLLARRERAAPRPPATSFRSTEDCPMHSSGDQDRIVAALSIALRIELPSWGSPTQGTRFGKYLQPAAAVTTDEDQRRGSRPRADRLPVRRVALHVLWDFPRGLADTDAVACRREAHGLRPGAINPNLFRIRNTSTDRSATRRPIVRERALAHCRDSIAIAQRLGSRDLSLWFADGSNYPGTANIRAREALVRGVPGDAARRSRTTAAPAGRVQTVRARASTTPMSPTGAWRSLMARARRAAGEGARRHRPPLPVAEHRADRRLAARRGHARRLPLQRPPLRGRRPDAGIDRSVPGVPHLPRDSTSSNGRPAQRADIAYMVDQSHNLKGKIEAMIQTVAQAQSLVAKARSSICAALAAAQQVDRPGAGRVLSAGCVCDRRASDRPRVAECCEAVPADPMRGVP